MLDVRYSHLYFYQSLNRLQRGLSAIAELLVSLSLRVLGSAVSFIAITLGTAWPLKQVLQHFE